MIDTVLFVSGFRRCFSGRNRLTTRPFSSLRSLAFTFLLPFALSDFAQAQPIPEGGEPPHFIQVQSKASLIHLGSLDSFDITEKGTKAATMLYECLTNKSPELAKKASELYEEIIPNENFGGEYTALQWLCDYLAAPEPERPKMLSDPLTGHFYNLLAEENYKKLRDYLKKKYHLEEWKNKRTNKSEPEFRFLEDFILFNNPRRERWEKTSKIMEVLNLKPGNVVADIGSGPGYFTFKFADLVGPQGYVYGIDVNPRHTVYLSKLAKELGKTNIESILPGASGLNLERKADVAYLCSLYHNIYALDTDEERDQFINGIKKSLKPDGSLVIVDNGLVEDTTLPYHGPHIARELIINQLWYYGFQLAKSYQFIPQRYILIFKMVPGAEPETTKFAKPLQSDCVPLNSKSSVIRSLKTGTAPGFTLPGRKAARLMATALDSKKPADLEAAIKAYREIIPKERFGDEYLALVWICEYLLAPPAEREKKLEKWTVRAYFDRIAADDYKMLKTYLPYKYYFDQVLDEDDEKRTGQKAKLLAPHEMELKETDPVNQDQLNEWGDFIAFNSPYRENWEHTSKVLDFLKLKPGERIADLGCGPGYYTFKFSEAVGTNGLVYAIDTLPTMTSYIDGVCKKHDIHNVETVLARDNNTRLPPNSVDLVYICSMYHAIYMTSLEYVKDGFINTLKPAMRKGARLVIADNAILKTKDNPYYGPTIAPELIITQLKHYGFRLVDRAQFIPQRYVLVFELEH